MADDFEERWPRPTALVGVVFVAALIAEDVLGANSLNPHSSGQAILASYRDHRGAAGVGAAMIMAILVLGVFFYALLADYLRRDPINQSLATVAFSGAVIFGVGGAMGEGFDYVLSYAVRGLDPSAARALFEAHQASQAVQQAGVAILGLASAWAILRTAVLPKWLGWVALLIGALSVLPGLPGVIGFIAVGLWTLAVSITVYVQLGHDDLTAVAPTNVVHA